MGQIIIKKGHGTDVLLGHGLDRQQVVRVTLAIGNTIEQSFKENARRDGKILHVPKTEVEKRFEICWEYAIKFIGDYKLTIREVEYYLPRALQCALAGIDYEPSQSIWEGRGS